MQDIINGRCGWCGTDELYVKYHDEEWGRLVTDDRTLFEFLVLESSQAGLSWITILKKREGYRKAFCNFDAGQVVQMTDEDVERLMQFEGIVRNRLKIKSTITNARLFLAVQKEFGSFYNYTLSFFHDGKPIVNTVHSLSDIPVSSPQSDAMSKDMKKTGIQVLREHDLLRAFAGSRLCQRPSGRMYLPPSQRGALNKRIGNMLLCLPGFLPLADGFSFLIFYLCVEKRYKCE